MHRYPLQSCSQGFCPTSLLRAAILPPIMLLPVCRGGFFQWMTAHFSPTLVGTLLTASLLTEPDTLLASKLTLLKPTGVSCKTPDKFGTSAPLNIQTAPFNSFTKFTVQKMSLDTDQWKVIRVIRVNVCRVLVSATQAYHYIKAEILGRWHNEMSWATGNPYARGTHVVFWIFSKLVEYHWYK